MSVYDFAPHVDVADDVLKLLTPCLGGSQDAAHAALAAIATPTRKGWRINIFYHTESEKTFISTTCSVNAALSVARDDLLWLSCVSHFPQLVSE